MYVVSHLFVEVPFQSLTENILATIGRGGAEVSLISAVSVWINVLVQQ